MRKFFPNEIAIKLQNQTVSVPVFLFFLLNSDEIIQKKKRIRYNSLIYVCFFSFKAISTIIQSNYIQDLLILQADVKVECKSNSLEVEGREQGV